MLNELGCAVVTGAGRGIGKAMSLALAERGWAVACVARTETEIRQVADQIRNAGGRAGHYPTDICDLAKVRQSVAQIQDELGPIDVLINNAGSFYALGPVAEVDADKWWRDVTINSLGTFNCCQAVLPHMIERRSGRIVTLTGGGTGNPLPFGSGYASSKAAVARFTECLAHEVIDHDVYVYAMSPGFVRTRLTEHHVFSDEGQKYLPMMKGSFDGDKQYPPDKAAAMAVFLAELKSRPLAGRILSAGTDTDKLLAEAQDIADTDRLQLRIT
ncbi:MAG: SDR family oxidoreductase [Phycisphaerae bacterium]|nr:SDR family oxidoreductase [Phycisphaerae bacterium]